MSRLAVLHNEMKCIERYMSFGKKTEGNENNDFIGHTFHSALKK